jgi:hypothetical protein
MHCVDRPLPVRIAAATTDVWGVGVVRVTAVAFARWSPAWTIPVVLALRRRGEVVRRRLHDATRCLVSVAMLARTAAAGWLVADQTALGR